MNYYLANCFGLQQKEVPAVGAVLQWNSRAHRHVVVTDLLPGTKTRREKSFLWAFRTCSFLSGYTMLINNKIFIFLLHGREKTLKKPQHPASRCGFFTSSLFTEHLYWIVHITEFFLGKQTFSEGICSHFLRILC